MAQESCAIILLQFIAVCVIALRLRPKSRLDRLLQLTRLVGGANLDDAEREHRLKDTHCCLLPWAKCFHLLT